MDKGHLKFEKNENTEIHLKANFLKWTLDEKQKYE